MYQWIKSTDCHMHVTKTAVYGLFAILCLTLSPRVFGQNGFRRPMNRGMMNFMMPGMMPQTGGRMPAGGFGGFPAGGFAGSSGGFPGQTVGALPQLGLQVMGRPALGAAPAGVYLHARYMPLYGLPLHWRSGGMMNGGMMNRGGLFGLPRVYGANYHRMRHAYQQAILQRLAYRKGMRNALPGGHPIPDSRTGPLQEQQPKVYRGFGFPRLDSPLVFAGQDRSHQASSSP